MPRSAYSCSCSARGWNVCHVAGGLGTVSERPGLEQRLLGLSDISECSDRVGAHLLRHLGDAPPFAKVDPFGGGVECVLRAMVGPGDAGEKAVDDAGLASQTLFERELERPPHVLHPAGMPQLAAGEAAPAERECRLGQADLRGERERPLGSRDRFRILRHVCATPRGVRVGTNELAAGRLLLEQLDCLGDQLPASRVAKPVDYEREARQNAPGRQEATLLAVDGDSLLERLPGVLEPSLLLRGMRPALEHVRASRVVSGSELERSG